MTTTIYKGYMVKMVGISRYIYRPGSLVLSDTQGMSSHGYAQSAAGAKRWINEDIKEQRSKTISQNVVVWDGLR